MGINDRMQDEKEARREARGKGKVPDAVWRGYINVELPPSVKAQYDDWVHTSEPWDLLAAIVDSGCVVTLKKNTGSSGYLGTVTQRDAANVNAGLCVSARSSDAGKALLRAVFIVGYLGVDDDWTKTQAPADPDRW